MQATWHILKEACLGSHLGSGKDICPPNLSPNKKWKPRVFKSSQVFTGHSVIQHPTKAAMVKRHLPLFDDVLPTLKGLGFQKTHQPQWRWNHRINEEWPCWAFAICTIRWDSYTLEIFPNACRNRVLLCVDVYRWYIYIHTLYSICRVDTQLDPLVTCGSCAPNCQYIWKRFEDIVKPGRYLTLNEGMLTVSTCSLQAEKATYVSPKDSPCFQFSLLMCMIRSIFLVDFCQRRSLLALRLSCRCLWQVGLGLVTSWIRWQIWTIQLWRVHECHLGIWLWSFYVIYPWWSVSPCYPESSHWSIDINRILRNWRSEMKPAKSIEP